MKRKEAQYVKLEVPTQSKPSAEVRKLFSFFSTLFVLFFTYSTHIYIFALNVFSLHSSYFAVLFLILLQLLLHVAILCFQSVFKYPN